jgi:hypothetical protein
MKTINRDECDANPPFSPVLPATAITRFQKQPLLQTSPDSIEAPRGYIPLTSEHPQRAPLNAIFVR